MLARVIQPARQFWQAWRYSSALQQGVLSLGIFLLCLLLLSIITYQVIQHDLAKRMDTRLEQRMSVLLQQADEEEDDYDDDDYLSSAPLPRALNDDLVLMVLPLNSLEQRQLTLLRKKGFFTRNARQLRRAGDDKFRILVRHQHGQAFVIGESISDDDEVLEIVSAAFWLNGLAALLLTGLLVIYLSQRSRRQLQRIEQVLKKTAQGDLSQRVGAAERQDDLARVSQQIDTMLAQLETTMTAMTDISANIAHELKTPISRLRHDLTHALERDAEGLAVSGALATAYQESAQITETFDALLRIAQIKGGARRANFAAVDVRALLKTLLEIYVEVAEDAGMKLHADLPAEPLPPLPGDRELLLQMLANLIENAVRYCPPGTGIRLAAELNGTQLRLLVADDGPGIPDTEREKVFQHLYRLDKSRSDAQGTGLGLSLVKAVVELHEGTVAIRDNQPGVLVIMDFRVTS